MFCHHLLLLVTAAAFVAADESLRLYHRVYHPIVPELPFALRGTVNINDSLLVTFRPSESTSESLQQFADSLQPGAVDLHDAQYQVALERAGDTAEAHWDISSVKLCHLENIKSESIILHTTAGPDPSPFAIDYFVSPIPLDGSCSKLKKRKSDSTALSSFVKKVQLLMVDTTVTVQRPSLPPLPELRAPPPITQTGEPVVPVPEKSFIQKYWLYIVAVLIALVMSGGPPEEEGKK
ncbi:hypothetical protein CCMSSC00406_0001423 [Pleurotus cornucopiae]|uniref:Uncharacterized protein n=1 Tax=Pleurotus cornucopiae TaxID=5321 RepID=A0ACB7INE9_PLECO|nr:hypothetical protein CCMSSC00406_0001423 [Pleurotus cornucopiae]